VPESRERVQAAIEELNANRTKAYRDLLDDLRRSYMAQVAAKEREERNEILQRYRAQFEAAVASLSADFESYASRRELPTIRLALLAGVPDPDPLSQQDTEIVGDLVPDRRARARAIRAELRALDAEFAALVRRRLDAVREMRDEQIAALLAGLETLQAELEARAEAEARAATQGSLLDQGLLTQLSERLPPAQAAVVVATPPQAPRAPAPLSSTASATPDPLETELEVWARINGYKRVGRPSEGRDATREFQVWRTQIRAGG